MHVYSKQEQYFSFDIDFLDIVELTIAVKTWKLHDHLTDQPTN